MWPWGHAAVGYILYSAISRTRRHRPPDRAATVAVLVGTQLPDLIDKPLAWTFGVLPSGRSLGHSLLTAAVLLLVVAAALRRLDRGELLLPFGVGHLSGILTDVPVSVFGGDLSGATFLLWPYLPSPTYPLEPSFVAHLVGVRLTPTFALQLLLLVVMVGLRVFVDAAPERSPGRRF